MGFIIRTITFFTSGLRRTFLGIADASATQVYPGGFLDKMTEREAYLILDATPEDDFQFIKDRHRRLIAINHPDRGGSNYLCFKVNEARDLLNKKDLN